MAELVKSEVNELVPGRLDLTPGQFEEIQSVTARAFTRFVVEKDECLSSDFNSLRNVCDVDLCGSHTWLNVQQSELRSSLLHYLNCKRKDPYATSACVLVPAVRRGVFRELLKQWKVVMEIRKGDAIMTVQDGVSTQTAARYHMLVLYDPVMSEQVSAVLDDGRLVMHFVGQAAGTEVDFLFDSGASANFVSLSFAKLHGLVTKPVLSNVRLGNGSTVRPYGECSLHVRINAYREQVDCFVIDVLSDF